MVLPWDGLVKKALSFSFDELGDYLSMLQRRAVSSVRMGDLLVRG
jgi:hypothetical protein